MLIDLHTHSSASDGSYTPRGLAALAAERGLSVLALTDHDTMAGVPEAAREAERRGLRLIPGVEIEIDFSPGEFHLLGYFLPVRPQGRLAAFLERLSRAREERNERILNNMREAGIPVTREELAAVVRGSRPGIEEAGESALPAQIGRPHLAALLVAKKVVKSKQEAFDLYLAKGRRFYEPKACVELGEAVEVIKEAGGRPVAAHPLSLFVSFTRLESIFAEWKEAGIEGIEAYHPGAKLGECRRLERLGRARGFRITAGSDFHGALRPERKLGRTAGDLKIEDSYLADLES